MAQTKTEIQSLLSQAATEPRHRFGQNFMIDGNLVRLVADAGGIGPNDLAIEVGPGTGTLTEELLTRAANVVAVEIDRDLARLLRERFADQPKFELIEGDAMNGKRGLNETLLERIRAAQAAGRGVRLVANLPYNIASPLVIEMLIAGVDSLAFTVQKEVADRLRAAAGGDAYGGLSAMAQLLARVEVLRTLPPQAFWPAPKIDSALVRMTRDDRLGTDANPFSLFLQQLFSARRKTIRKGLTQFGYAADESLAKLSIDPQFRVEVISPDLLYSLYRATRL